MAQNSRYHAESYVAHPVVTTADMRLLFHRASGETHLLADPLPDMLILLGEQPDTIQGLTTRLCARLGVAQDEEAHAVVGHRLDELEAAGLVWRD
ncbi:HPr-rel-A system PqqD family peptide chaperone [Sphingomonas montanisoli]|uniref:HPr-rel-A system PqqD family peptide chaperone n=1 Tax=Sphingomonas montanisoli TaxID=2606412 RepID=A0A5D9CBY6_9SPHN|nr:HPr-rel-A system PqqD family peptide chaperone [Sphingomonas montanisoli]TZG28753.1 HPr-rel-A system PqqD family peptide chaperone [Sphingomonas montanisoli]